MKQSTKKSLLAVLLVCLAVFALWEMTKVRHKGKFVRVECPTCGQDRHFIHYFDGDAFDAEKPTDLFVVLHGLGSTAKKTIAATHGRFEDLASSGEVVVAHAQSDESRNWYIGDIGSVPKGATPPTTEEIDDLAYFEALWTKVKSFHSSLNRIHLVGLSRGAMASYAIACSQRFPVASLTVFTMPMPEMAVTGCEDVSGIDFMLVNGTEDRLVPYFGGPIELPWLAFEGDRRFGNVIGTPETLNRWQDANGCDRYTTERRDHDDAWDDTAVTMQRWTACERASVTHIRILGGGHRWDNERWNPLNWLILGASTREVAVVEALEDQLGIE